MYKNFTEIAKNYGIDKGVHHECHLYTEIYEEYMSDFLSKIPVIIEIGVNDPRFPGGCLQFWDKVFDNMEYYGFELTNCGHLSYNQSKIKIFQGDQNNEHDLRKFKDTFNLNNRVDFIIDDGSHIKEHIITSFKELYPCLVQGGVYFIEDLHAGVAEVNQTIDELKEILIKNSWYTKHFELTTRNKLLVIVKQ
jgi:demethylmacrocin O-methyltransferase